MKISVLHSQISICQPIEKLQKQKMLTSKIRGEHFFADTDLPNLMTLVKRAGSFFIGKNMCLGYNELYYLNKWK